MTLSLLAGLGNPEARYSLTRHNAGFWLVDALADSSGIALKLRRRFSSWLGEGKLAGRRLILVKPARYMNNSGPPLRRVLDYFHLHPAQALVVVDDVNLPPGRLRLRRRGGAGGHHGLESVIEALGSRDFPRLRIGVGGGERSDLVGHVLSPVSASERELYRAAIERAREAVLRAFISGLEEAMNECNAVPAEGTEELSQKGGGN